LLRFFNVMVFKNCGFTVRLVGLVGAQMLAFTLPLLHWPGEYCTHAISDDWRNIAMSLVIPAPLPVSESGVRRAVERSRFAAEPSVLQFREVKVHSTGPSSSRNDGAMQPLPRPTQNCCTAMKTHKAIVLPNPLKPHLKRTS